MATLSRVVSGLIAQARAALAWLWWHTIGCDCSDLGERTVRFERLRGSRR